MQYILDTISQTVYELISKIFTKDTQNITI